MAVAYFDPETGTIYALEDTQEGEHWDVITMCRPYDVSLRYTI
jgi:hypothetical protein